MRKGQRAGKRGGEGETERRDEKHTINIRPGKRTCFFSNAGRGEGKG